MGWQLWTYYTTQVHAHANRHTLAQSHNRRSARCIFHLYRIAHLHKVLESTEERPMDSKRTTIDKCTHSQWRRRRRRRSPRSNCELCAMRIEYYRMFVCVSSPKRIAGKLRFRFHSSRRPAVVRRLTQAYLRRPISRCTSAAIMQRNVWYIRTKKHTHNQTRNPNKICADTRALQCGK